MSRWFYLLFLSFCFISSSVCDAFQFPSQKGGSQTSVEIDARGGIRCEKGRKVCTSTGGVVVRRGDMVLTAREVVAFFKEGVDGNQEVRRLEAHGNVHIYSKSKPQRAFSEHAIYVAEDESVRLTGGRQLRLEIQDMIIRARDVIGYKQKVLQAFAQGDATAVQGDKILQARELVAYLQEGASQKLTLKKLHANQDVVISTPLNYAEGDRGVYDAQTEIATLQGHTEVSRCEGQLRGDVATLNLKTGISTVERDPPKTKQRQERVRVLLLPKSGEKDSTPTPLEKG